MSFAERMQSAHEFEQAVLDRLNATGWQAFPFGQSQLPNQARQLLIRYEDAARRPCLIRWLADIIAFRETAGGKVWTMLVDAKVCGERTQNYAVEMSAYETAEAFTDQLFTPTFFVFDDWKVLTPREVRQRGLPGPPPKAGNGSGTPYVLVSKRWGRPFDEVFPPSGLRAVDGAA